MSFASRSHYPKFVKLEGLTRRHLPAWQDHLGHSDTFQGRFLRFPALEISHYFPAQTYLILSVGIFPTSKPTLSCLALLLLVLTSGSRQKDCSLPPCGTSYVFLYLRIYFVLFPSSTQFISSLLPQLLATEK